MRALQEEAEERWLGPGTLYRRLKEMEVAASEAARMFTGGTGEGGRAAKVPNPAAGSANP